MLTRGLQLNQTPRPIAVTLELNPPADLDNWLKPEESANPRDTVVSDLIVLVTFRLGVCDQPLFSLQAYWTAPSASHVWLIYRRKGVSSNEIQDGFQTDIALCREPEEFYDSDAWPAPPADEDGVILAALEPCKIKNTSREIRPNTPGRLLRVPGERSFDRRNPFKRFDGMAELRKIKYEDGSVTFSPNGDFLIRLGKNVRYFVK